MIKIKDFQTSVGHSPPGSRALRTSRPPMEKLINLNKALTKLSNLE